MRLTRFLLRYSPPTVLLEYESNGELLTKAVPLGKRHREREVDGLLLAAEAASRLAATRAVQDAAASGTLCKLCCPVCETVLWLAPAATAPFSWCACPPVGGPGWR